MQKIELTSKEIAAKIAKTVDKTGWDTALRMWWISTEFEEIIDKLKEYSDIGYTWCPVAKNIYQFLKKVKYQDVRVVIMVDEPINIVDHNTGIPLHIQPIVRANKTITPKPLWTIQDMMKSMGIPEEKRTYNLDRWMEQGVLLIPTALTVRVQGTAHKKLWEPFHMRLIEQINKLGDIPVILIKTAAIEYENHYSSSNVRVIKSPPWTDKEWYKWVNQVLENNNQKPIVWE